MLHRRNYTWQNVFQSVRAAIGKETTLAPGLTPLCGPPHAISDNHPFFHKDDATMSRSSAASLLTRDANRGVVGSRRASCPGLFVVGTDTGVGKTYVASRIA